MLKKNCAREHQIFFAFPLFLFCPLFFSKLKQIIQILFFFFIFAHSPDPGAAAARRQVQCLWLRGQHTATDQVEGERGVVVEVGAVVAGGLFGAQSRLGSRLYLILTKG